MLQYLGSLEILPVWCNLAAFSKIFSKEISKKKKDNIYAVKLTNLPILLRKCWTQTYSDAVKQASKVTCQLYDIISLNTLIFLKKKYLYTYRLLYNMQYHDVTKQSTISLPYQQMSAPYLLCLGLRFLVALLQDQMSFSLTKFQWIGINTKRHRESLTNSNFC